jgi:DNA helicase-2/ATP-dependent DNA helicase PcrA
MNRSEQLPIPDTLIKEILPSGDYHLEEERRLFYVGTTRARDRLFLTAANFYGDGKIKKKLSPFLIETLGEKIVNTKAFENKNFSINQLPQKPESSAIPHQSLIINTLSYSQIDAFQICPLHYKLKYILNIPTPPTGATSFALQFMKLSKIFIKKLQRVKALPKVIKNLLEKNWIQDGYITKKHEEKYLQKGFSYLEGFLKKSFDKSILPTETEQTFNSPLDKSLRLIGRIDRIDKLADGKIEIIDYKTSEKVPTQKEVDKNKQLTFYALLTNQNPENIILSLYYFENQTKISTSRTKKDLEDFKKELFKIREEIQKATLLAPASSVSL